MYKQEKFTSTDIIKGAIAIGTISSIAFIGLRYKICRPEQIMIKTGLGIKEMFICKKGIRWPLQDTFMVNMTPKTFSFNLHNMSNEKVEFRLPVTFTVGPIHYNNDEEGFKNYANYINGMEDDEFYKTLLGMVEGEMRILTASMTVDEIFSNKKKFQEDVVDKIGIDLNKLGIRIVNANIQEMADYNEENKFFEYRRQRAIQTANYDAQKDVAEARKKGEIGMETQDSERRIKIAQLDKEAVYAENLRRAEIALSEAELAEAKAISKKRTDIANIEAKIGAEERKVELEKELYVKTQLQEIEKQRSINFVTAKVFAESLIVESEGKANSFIIESESKANSMKLLAEASLYQKQKEAEGIKAVYEAQARGLNELLKSTDNNPELTQFYLALDKNLYPQLAKYGADAVQNMKPNIRIWNTGSDPNDPTIPITKLVQSLNPLMHGMKEEGGMIFPDWLPKIGDDKTLKIIKNNQK
jgi:flotillin